MEEEEIFPPFPPFVEISLNCTDPRHNPDLIDLRTNSSMSIDLDGNLTNGTDPDFIPPFLATMSDTSRNCVIAYIILFLISATGNLSVFVSVFQQVRKTKSRICVLILHLSIADLMVTFFMMPIEVAWRITVAWYGGNILCKICQFLRAFGLYLSSMVLICISMDRYFAIIHPLKTSRAKRRGRVMLFCAWASATLCSAPQMLKFGVQRHPQYPAFQQCVDFGYFTKEEEKAYSISSVVIMYIIPLLVIIYTYGRILWKISRKSRQHQKSRKNLGEVTGKILLRRSEGTNHLERAKIRTLRLTLFIVFIFVLCSTPYVLMTLWYMFDREEAKKVDGNIQEALFIMAVANSCVNPVVYGSYTKECRDTVIHCCVDKARRRTLRNHGLHSKSTISSRAMSTTALETTQARNHHSSPDQTIQSRLQSLNRGTTARVSGRKSTVTFGGEGQCDHEELRSNLFPKKEEDEQVVDGCPPSNQMIPLKHYRCIHQLGDAVQST